MSVLFRIITALFLCNGGLLSHAQAKDTTSILLFGDSIIAGYGLAKRDSIPVRLEALLHERNIHATVINGGVSGDTTGSGRNRLGWMLRKYQPDMVVLALGGNDILRGIPPEMIEDNLRAMLDMLKERQVKTLLSAVRTPDNLGAAYGREIDKIYKKLAREYEVPLYPFLLEAVYNKNGMMQEDGIHPAKEGAEVIAKGLADYIVGRGK